MLPVNRRFVPTLSRFFEDDWDSFFDFESGNHSITKTTIPSVNIKENPNEFVVEMAAPGMKKEDFQIEIDKNVLTIKSEFKDKTEENDGDNYTRREFSYQSFQRSFNLNQNVVDDGKIKAKYENGVLELSLPKKEEAKEKPARMIKIS
jgi:HSP20 family protein